MNSATNTEVWKILQVMRVNADRQSYISPVFAGDEMKVRNALCLSDAVLAHIKVELTGLSGSLAGSVRTYIGTIPGTQDAIIITLQQVSA